MPRKPRLNMAGFHHIVNRGIERSNVYRTIVEAIADGYKQVEIAEFLSISSSAVSKIITIKSGNS